MEELEGLYNLMVQSKLTKNSFSAFKSEFESSADYRKQIFNTIQSQKGITKLKAFSGANIATFENRYISKPTTKETTKTNSSFDLISGFDKDTQSVQDRATAFNYQKPVPYSIHEAPDLTTEEFKSIAKESGDATTARKKLNQRYQDILNETGLKEHEYPELITGYKEEGDQSHMGVVYNVKDPIYKKATLEQMEQITTDATFEYREYFEELLSDEFKMLQNYIEEPTVYETDLDKIHSKVLAAIQSKHPGLNKRAFMDIVGGTAVKGLFQTVLDKVTLESRQKYEAKSLSELTNLDLRFLQEITTDVRKRFTSDELKKEALTTQIREKNRTLKSLQELGGDASEISKLKLEINEHKSDIIKIATSSRMPVFGTTREEVIDPKLASERFTDETTKYRQEQIEKAKTSLKTNLLTQVLEQKDTNPRLTEWEAHELLYKSKAYSLQRLWAAGNTEKINLKFHGGRAPDLFNKLVKAGYISKDQQKVENYSKVNVNIPIKVLFDAGYDGRDFEGLSNTLGYDVTISEEDKTRLLGYESAIYRNKGELELLYELTYINNDPETFDREGFAGEVARSGVVSVLTHFTDIQANEADDIASLGPGATDSKMLDEFSKFADTYNIAFEEDIISGEIDALAFTSKELKAIERTFGEQVGEGFGHFVPMLIELGIISAATGAVMSTPKIAQLLSGLRNAGGWKKAQYHAIMLMVEEGKMFTAGFDPGAGASFYAGGQLTSGVGFKKRFKWMDPIFQKVIKGGAVGAASSEIAVNVEAGIQDLLGNKDFQATFDTHYGDLTFKDVVANALVFSIAGAFHAKKTDFMSTRRKYDAVTEIDGKMNELMNNPIGKLGQEGINRGLSTAFTVDAEGNMIRTRPEGYEMMSETQQVKWDALNQAKINIERLIRAETTAIELDPTNKNFESNVNKMYTDPVNQTIKSVHKDFSGFKVEFTENANDPRFDPGAEAMYLEGKGSEAGTILFIKDKFSPEKLMHEISHSGMESYFKRNPAVEARFIESMANKFKEFDFKDYEGTPIGEFISKAYGRSTGGKDMRTMEGKSLANREFLAYMFELLTDPKIYYQKVAPTFFKEAKQEMLSIMEEVIGIKPKVRTVKDFVEFIGRLSQDARRGLGFQNKMARLADLDEFSFLGIQFIENNKKRPKQAEALQSRNLSIEKAKLVNEKLKLEKESKEESKARIKEIDKEIIEIDKNINSSNVNAEQVIKFKDAVAEEKQLIEKLGEKPKNFVNPKKERAVKVLKENNEGILNEFVNNNYADIPGSNLTKREFKLYVENNEFLKLLNSYNTDLKVPFGAYLKTNLEFRLGNILKALGVDMKIQSVTSSMSDPKFKDTRDEFVEDAPDFDTQFRNDNIPGGTDGILLVYKLPVKQATIDAISGEVPSIIERIQLGEKVDYGTIIDFTPEATKDMFGKTTKDKATFIVENEKTLYTAMPKSTSGVTGKGTGITNNIYKLFYQKTGEAVKMADTGSKAGNKIQEKLPYRKGILLDAFGIKYNESTREVDVTSMDRNTKVSTLPGFESIIGRAITNQVLGRDPRLAPWSNNITSGKAVGLASKLLNKFSDKFNLPLEKTQDILLNYAIGNKLLVEKKYRDYLDNFPGYSDPRIGALWSAVEVEGLKGKTTATKFMVDFNNHWDNFKGELPNGVTVKDVKSLKVKAFYTESEGNVLVETERLNKQVDITVEFASFLPKGFEKSLTFFDQVLGLHQRVTQEKEGRYAKFKEGESGVEADLTGFIMDSKTGEPIIEQPFTRGRERALKNLGKNVSDIWKDIDIKFKSASSQEKGQKEIAKAKTFEQQLIIAEKYFTELDNKTKEDIYFAIEATKQEFIEAGKTKQETLDRIEWMYNVARSNANLRMGVRQTVPVKYVFFPEAPITKEKIKLEHLKAMVTQSIQTANLVASGMFKKYGKQATSDFIGITSTKDLLDIVDALGGLTNTSGLYRMALLNPGILSQFRSVESGFKRTLLQDIQMKFEKEIGVKEYKIINESNKKLNQQLTEKLTSVGLASKNLTRGEKEIAIKDIVNAIKLGKNRNKVTKGMSTWDFDGTLATTKSGVRATIPNPSGKPKPNRKVIFMAGGAGSGKGNVIKKLDLQGQGFKVVNSDISLEWLKKNNGLPENMNDFTPEQRSLLGSLQNQARGIAKNKMMKYKGNADGVVVDGTGGSIKVMEGLVKEFKDNGYDVSMVFVETSLETALARNATRAERSLLDVIVRKNHELVQGNKEGFKEMFGDRFMEVNTDNIKQEDAMPTELISKMKDFVSGYEKVRLDAEQFANDGKRILDAGGKFDFAEFNVVTEGAQGPMFQTALNRAKKFGTKDQFILTARPQEAALPIYEFLKSQGLEIPIENITGLGNSTGEAKALWMIKKFAEGYNDMYFADDVIQNTSAVKSALDKLQVKSKVVLAKGTQEQQLNNIKNPDKLDSPGVYQGLASRNLRAEYEKTISKLRPDLVKEGSVSRMVDEMFDFIDTLKIPENKKRKYEQITTKWLATGNIRIKEDAFRIKKAMELADRYKEDVFSYRNPNEIIEKYAGKVKVKPTVPKSTKEFTLLSDAPLKERGVEEVMIADSRNGQAQARKIVNRHWGNESNPWCLTQVKDGKLTEDAWTMWTSYDKGPKHLVFQDGKLIAFKADNVYWDRMNHRTEGVIINVKEGRVTHRTELTRESTTKSSGVEVKGAIEPVIRETRTVSEDGNTVKTEIFENSKDGYTEGTVLIENRTKGVRTKETRFDPDGTKASVQEFNKAGKPTTSYEFSPDGKIKSVNGHLQKQAINEAGLDVNAREDVVINLADNLVKKVGDILEKNYTEKDAETGVVTDYFYGRVSLGGKVVEIGFESKSNLDLADVTKTVDGKTRIDINKVLEVDPTLKGLPKDFKPSGTGMQNIKIVKQVLDQLDIKSDVQQGLASKNLNKSFNDIIEQTTKVESEKVFSDAQAKIRGAKKRYDSIIPASVQDLGGLLYNFLGKGKVGEKQMEFFKENLIDPFSKGINELNQSRQATSNDYNNLLKSFPDVKSKLNKSIEGSDFTYDQAIRVHLWNKAGFEIPGLSKRDLNALDSVVKNNPELQAFADLISTISKKEAGYSKPSEHWLVENITSELLSGEAVSQSRSEFLAEWKQNSSEIFSKENLNKIQATYGNKFREALEDILYRMENGTNRPTGSSRLTNNFMNWINNSTGAIMFFNMRSALLQTLSTTNYINWAENNPLKAATAFANQKQYWKDFSELFNSDFLKQRRSGNQRSINEAELSAAVANSDSKPKAALAWLLQKGFLPTQIADSFAISSGGATFYRNRINKYIKEGMSPEQAREKAFLDFQEITEATQQSARPDMISQQQASPLGRLILSFQNTPMQYARIMNKAARDIASGRGDQKSNISKIVYYGALQSIIFGAMQSAIFASLGDDEEEEFDKKKERIMYSMVDGWLAGLGVTGKAVGTIEKSIKEYLKQKDKGFKADHARTIMQLLGFSPPVGSKVRKIHGSIQTERFNKGVSEKRGFTLDNPTWSTYGNVVEGFTNVPMGRLANKMLNIDNALDSQNEWWERAALLLGWNTWDLGIKDPDIEAARKEVKQDKKDQKPVKKKYSEMTFEEIEAERERRRRAKELKLQSQ
jgi:hypothetical protein